MAPRNTRVTPETQVRSPARSFLQSLDNFYAPARDRRSEEAFQRGINAFSGIFEEKAREAKAEQRQNEYQQGVMDAMREEAGHELQGVKTGSIFRQHSKYYMAGLNETRGKAAASRFKQDFAHAYEEWEGKHTDVDGSGFRQFANERIGLFLQGLGEDQYMAAGALPILNEVANNYATQHTAFINQRIEEESWSAYDDIISGAFDGYANGEYDMDKLVDRLAFEADDMYLTEGGAANDRMVDAAIKYANIHNDPDALLALAKAHDGGKIKLSVANQEKLANAMDAVEADLQREASRVNAQTDAEEKARRKATLDAWGKQLQEDPYAKMPSWQEVGDYTTYTQMQTLADAFQKASTNQNPKITSAQRMKFEIDLHSASSPAERIKVLSEFIAANPAALGQSDVSKYTQDILELSNPGSVINDPTVGRFREGFTKSLMSFQTDDLVSLDTVANLSIRGEMLYNEFLLSQAGRVDLSDPQAIYDLTQRAQQYAIQQLTYEFPNEMQLRNAAKPGEGDLLGVSGALQNRQDEIDRKAAEEFAAAAGIDPSTLEGVQNQDQTDPAVEPQEQVVEPQEGDEASPEGDLPLDQQPTPFEDHKSDEAYTPTRNGFYGELIKRFTDGRDDRITSKGYEEILRSDTEFALELKSQASLRGMDPQAILAVMDFETGGSFDTGVRNAAGSGATGLIQFMPSTAKALGTTTERLSQMGKTEQLEYVFKYFDQFGFDWRDMDVDDVYMAVLYPKAVGKSDGYVLFRSGTTAYTQNRGLDTNNDGTVTKFEAASKVRKLYYG